TVIPMRRQRPPPYVPSHIPSSSSSIDETPRAGSPSRGENVVTRPRASIRLEPPACIPIQSEPSFASWSEKIVPLYRPSRAVYVEKTPSFIDVRPPPSVP